jgi:Spy/CpxP family protein refolding chaperone
MAVVLVTLLPAVALAQPFGRGHGGMGHGMGMGGMGGGMGLGLCAGMLMRAHPDVLKAKLSATDAQVKQIEAARVNFFSQRIKLQSQAQQLMLQGRSLLLADLPDLNKVLDLSRKMRGVRGQMMEERIKASFKMLQALTKEQRATLRTQCTSGKGMGKGGGWGKGGRWGGGGWGKGGGGGGGGGDWD